ncbi:MAG: redoxin family protein [Patescibacteria group bacterium]|nr:redoxin family protein [Patescibacteria group bacterium]
MTFFIISFLAGVLTILAPCILPLLPVVLGSSMAEAGNRRRPLVIIGALCVSVFAFTLILKGSTALISASPSFWNWLSAAILTLFGLTLVFPDTWAKIMLKVPGHNNPDKWLSKGYQNRAHWWADIAIGAALGPVFTTCSPTFFVILATVLPESVGAGLLDLLAYIVGLALALLLIAWLGQKIVGKLEWASNPYGWFRKTLGVLFVLLAVVIIFGWDKRAEADILNSGFFDVTRVEQAITETLQGRQSPNDQGDGASNEVSTTGMSTSTNPTASTTTTGSTKTSNSNSSSFLRNIFGSGNSTADERNEGKYIEIQDPAGFVNTPNDAPITLSQFVGKKVVLIDFIDYSCINCERTFPYLESWWNKYKSQGLEIVAIHTPEFSFEKDISNVTAAAKQFGLTFPIVLDNNYATWNAYKNEYWPHKYLIDANGNIIYDHIGEGAYDETEAEIVKQLNILHQKLGQPANVIEATSTLPGVVQINTQSPETYFGAMRNEYFGNGAPGVSGTQTFTVPNASVQLSPNEFYLGGTWNIEQEYAAAVSTSTSISYYFDATKMYMVAATADGKPVTATILVDGAPIPATWRGSDVRGDTLTITASRLYNIFSSPIMEPHRIDIIFNQPGVQAYTFTFG